MMRRYDAFLVRHWSLDGERGDRVEITHIQTGERSPALSLAQALAWVQARVERVPASERAPPAGAPDPGIVRRP